LHATALILVAPHDLNFSTRAPSHPSTLTRIQLYIVDQRPHRDPRQRQCIPHGDRRVRPCHHIVAYVQLIRRQDVSLIAILEKDQGDEGRPIRIVFDRRYTTRYSGVVAAEIYDPIPTLVSSPATSRRDTSAIVATT
jgi:hypothetical protein